MSITVAWRVVGSGGTEGLPAGLRPAAGAPSAAALRALGRPACAAAPCGHPPHPPACSASAAQILPPRPPPPQPVPISQHPSEGIAAPCRAYMTSFVPLHCANALLRRLCLRCTDLGAQGCPPLPAAMLCGCRSCLIKPCDRLYR